MLLKVQNFSISFFNDKNQATASVSDLSFEVEQGEILGIVGESGSGKSVTCLSLLNLIPSRDIHSQKGIAEFNSKKGIIDLFQCKHKELQEIRRNEISMIFQEPMSALNPVITCGKQIEENLELAGIPKKQRKEKALDLMNEVLIPDLERAYHSYPHQLSGGQRQRIMIAMALAGNPKLLIADEPTTALDISVQESIIELLLKLKKDRNLAIIFISHDLSVIKKFCDKVLVMYKGKSMEYASKNDVFNNPQSPYTKALLNCKPGSNYDLEFLPVLNDFFEIDANQNLIAKPLKDWQKTSRKEKKEDYIFINDIEKIYHKSGKDFQALSNINFEIKKGETLALIGESGSGKTSLGRILVRLIQANSGHLKIGNDTYNLMDKRVKKEFRKKVQIIFQDPYAALNPKLKVGNCIAEVFEQLENLNKKKAKEAAERLLSQVGLGAEFYQRYPHQLSGGQRQRVCIARALACNPDLLICDESVAALDVSVQSQILNLLRKIQNDLNVTYLFITHDLGVVRFIADRIILLKSGKIEEINSNENFFHSPESDYGKSLLKIYKEAN